MEFFTQYNFNKNKPQETGNSIYKTYIELSKPNGEKYLKETGEYNLEDKIQEARYSTELSYILNNLNIKNEDLKTIGVELNNDVADYTNLPKNEFEIINNLNKGREIFENQSKEVKEFFNNNFQNFIENFENYKMKENEMKETNKTNEGVKYE